MIVFLKYSYAERHNVAEIDITADIHLTSILHLQAPIHLLSASFRAEIYTSFAQLFRNHHRHRASKATVALGREITIASYMYLGSISGSCLLCHPSLWGFAQTLDRKQNVSKINTSTDTLKY